MTVTLPPRIAITPGEPAGVGPDLCLQLVQQAIPAECVLIADPDMLQQRAEQCGLSLTINVFDPDLEFQMQQPGIATVLPIKLKAAAQAGQLDKRNARYVLDTLDAAIDGCRNQTFAAMVTGPVHKGIINEAGVAFTGHTEYLAERCKAPLPVMMLQTDTLRVALVTTHLPLAQVAAAINQDLLTTLIRILHRDLQQKFAIARPHIFVCGLNPHAGENGHLGREELDIIEPVLRTLREEGIRLSGPLSADTIYRTENREQADVFLAMYHDQGLPVLKTIGFGEAINITLGLPIIRTSVDHGTALEIAGTGQAHPRSLLLALETAIEMAQHHQQQLQQQKEHQALQAVSHAQSQQQQQ